MNYGDLNAALQRFLRWGSPNMQGLEQLLKQLREAREKELGRYNLDSTVEQLRQKVQDVIDTERSGIEQRLKDATPEARKLLDRIARQRNDQLDRLPDDLGGRVKGLRNYEFVDDAARQKFEELMQELQKQILDQMFQGIKGSLQQMQGQDLSRVRDMVRELNKMLEQRMEGRTPDFNGFMQRFGDMFPPGINNLDDLLEHLQRQMAQMQSLMQSLSRQALDQLRQVTDVLEKAGYVERKGRRLELTPRGMRRIGQSALRDIFDQLKKTRMGQHNLWRGGLGTDASEELKAYEYGDPFLLEMKETLFNSIVREGPKVPVKMSPRDFIVHRTEHMTQASTVLMIDMSRSMFLRGCFLAAKKVAIALDSLIRSQYPRDSLYVVGFSNYAVELKPHTLPQLALKIGRASCRERV